MQRITISDISLKESLKNESINLTFKEKLEIVKRLCELGIEVIELPVALNKADELLIKTVCACTKNSTLSLSVSNEKEIANAKILLANAKSARLSVNIPVSPVYMEYFSAKKPKAVLEVVKNLTKLATEVTSLVEVNLLDATRADGAFLSEVVKTAIENGATVITLTDMVGEITPFEFGEFVKGLYVAVPELNNVCLGVQVCDDFAMAMSSILTALENGVKEVKVSAIDGLGLVKFETFAKVMEFLASKKGFTCGINKTLIGKSLKVIETTVAKRGAVGAMNNEKGKGLISKDITEKDFASLIASNGYDLSAEDFNKVYEEFKRIAERKSVTLTDLEVIISNVSMQVPETFVLDKFSVNSSNVLTATASIVVKKDGKEISGLSFGNGAVDACFLALENVAGEHFELEDFEIGAVTEGKEAMAQAIVKLRSDGKVFTGRGVSTDVIGASIRSYVNALNKIVYERGNK